MKKRLSSYLRARQTLARHEALQKSLAFERSLTRQRGKAIAEAIKRLSAVPPSHWDSEVHIDEPYLGKMYQDLYLNVGVDAARQTVQDFINRKDDGDDFYINAILKWTSSHLGERITLSNKTINKWLADLCRRVYEENRTEGVEKVTQLMYAEVEDKWKSIREWEVRRIAQTETMKSLNIARSQSMDALGVQYTKTWVVSGNNTRPSHLVMDRETIQQGELFIVGGYYMSEPMDESYGAPASEIINCSCGLIYRPI
jgi:hypothetical protein